MKAFIIAAMLGVAASQGADCAYAAADGDHGMRPRPEYSPRQAEFLVAPRTPVDGSMKASELTQETTNFGRYGFVDLTESAEPEVVSAP